MSRQGNRWALLAGWAVMMLLLWNLFVPAVLSVGSFVLLCVVAPGLAVAGRSLLNSQRPSPSIRQVRATLDAEERARADAPGR